jgi:hypothetical protein
MSVQMGNESRTSVLPAEDTSRDMTPPEYNFADELPFPDQVGVRRGGSLSDVASGVRGIAWYADMIGFGAPSTGMTRGGLEPYPMGVNFFLRTKTKCSNGADMWVYVNGIPKGDMFGEKVKQALQRLNMPTFRGLAPGIMEDARDGLNPVPITNAVFGSGYAKCKQVTLPVGDHLGRLKNVDGKTMVSPLYPGDIKMIGGRPHQTRFVFDQWQTKEDWDKEHSTPTFCPDGSLIDNHDGYDCSKPIIKTEGFRSSVPANSHLAEASLPAALLVALAAAVWFRYK